jgi:hypothetical protein
MKCFRALSFALAACAALLTVAPPAAAQNAGAFSAGRKEVMITGGSGSAFNDTYLILGVGAAYYVLDGLNVGLSAQAWFGGDPGVYNVTPSIEYVFHQIPKVKPYVGAFYRRTFIDGRSDLNSTGLRAGVYVEAGRNNYLGLGVVHQSFSDCSANIYIKCDSDYVEATFKFAF